MNKNAMGKMFDKYINISIYTHVNIPVSISVCKFVAKYYLGKQIHLEVCFVIENTFILEFNLKWKNFKFIFSKEIQFQFSPSICFNSM